MTVTFSHSAERKTLGKFPLRLHACRKARARREDDFLSVFSLERRAERGNLTWNSVFDINEASEKFLLPLEMQFDGLTFIVSRRAPASQGES